MFFSRKEKQNKSGISYCIIGLGNPGKGYERTRHNMGFMVLDCLADKLNANVGKLKHKALIGDARIGGEKVLLVKPQTFMNLSGEAVRQIMSYYKLEDEQIIVIYDDIDIPFGTCRIRKKGGPGTHNGMKSIINEIGSSDFTRIRVGIGAQGGIDLKDYVLGKIPDSESKALNELLEKCADAAAAIVTDGIDRAMNKFNG